MNAISKLNEWTLPEIRQGYWGVASYAYDLERISSSGHDFQPSKLNHQLGRLAAARALKQIGHTDYSLVNSPTGAPLWPPGIIGSISHSNGHAIAAVMADKGTFGLGVDLESIVPITACTEIVEICLTNKERRNLGSLVNSPPLITTLFSLKESIYKALSCRLQRFIDFKEVELAITSSPLEFHIADMALPEISSTEFSNLDLRYKANDEFIVTSCCWSYQGTENI